MQLVLQSSRRKAAQEWVCGRMAPDADSSLCGLFHLPPTHQFQLRNSVVGRLRRPVVATTAELSNDEDGGGKSMLDEYRQRFMEEVAEAIIECNGDRAWGVPNAIERHYRHTLRREPFHLFAENGGRCGNDGPAVVERMIGEDTGAAACHLSGETGTRFSAGFSAGEDIRRKRCLTAPIRNDSPL